MLFLCSCSGTNKITNPDDEIVYYKGQEYHKVKIGEQVWLKENLNAGVMIPSDAKDNNQIDIDIIEKYCYDNDPQNCVKYGALYQWDEAMNYSNNENTKDICPPGWHIPNQLELEILVNSHFDEAKNLIDTSESPSAFKPSNQFGFSGYFSGYRGSNGKFNEIGNVVYFMSSTEDRLGYATTLGLISSFKNTYIKGTNKVYGICVRCLQD
jgi:uncharacterized protein (TIGR02145 family)